MEKRHLKRPPSFSAKNDGLDENRFNSFVYAAK